MRIWIRLREMRVTKAQRKLEGEVWRPAVEVEYGDNGVGFDADQQKQMFTPFFTTKETGNGLGLSIVERIVGGHEGLIDVSSSAEEGTVFRVQLPLLRSSDTSASDASENERHTDQTEQHCHV